MNNNIASIVYHQHNIVCNQKYGNDNLPYSFHLKAVLAQGKKFMHLLPNYQIENKQNVYSNNIPLHHVIEAALIGHDLIEDGRMTYNDVKELYSRRFGNSVAGSKAADIIYDVSDEKGKSRAERKNDKYYKGLQGNPHALFVKLADLAANTLFSKLTGSSMYEKYKKEFPEFKRKTYTEGFKEFYDYIEAM